MQAAGSSKTAGGRRGQYTRLDQYAVVSSRMSSSSRPSRALHWCLGLHASSASDHLTADGHVLAAHIFRSTSTPAEAVAGWETIALCGRRVTNQLQAASWSKALRRELRDGGDSFAEERGGSERGRLTLLCRSASSCPSGSRLGFKFSESRRSCRCETPRAVVVDRLLHGLSEGLDRGDVYGAMDARYQDRLGRGRFVCRRGPWMERKARP